MDSVAGHRLFIGTYSRSGSRGIYAARCGAADGALSEPELAAETGNPTFLAFGPGRKALYAVRNSPSYAAAFAVGANGGDGLDILGTPDPDEAPGPCHVAVDRTGCALVTTHFHTGVVAAIPILPDRSLGAPAAVIRHEGSSAHPSRQASAHPHSATISPDGRFAIVCDLGLDRIVTYAFDPARAALEPSGVSPVATPPGSGPRHFAFGPGGHQAYAINEISSTILAFDYNAGTGGLVQRQEISTLPPGFTGDSSAAEVAVHPNGRFLYGSNRGHDSIAAFRIEPEDGLLSPIETVPCGGRAPRHFAFSPDGRWIVCAHQDSGTLCSFGVDAATGRLTPTGSVIAVPLPVCVLFLD